MKTQLRPAGLLLRFQRSSTAEQGGLITLRQVLRVTRTNGSFNFNFSALSPARPSCRLQSASQWMGRAAFSTSSSRRAAEEQGTQASSEVKGGVPGAPPAGGKATYPERLIIYHAGTGKTTFLACLKVTTLFIFGFFDMIMTPAYIAAGEPLLKTAGVALCGIIPAIYVAWSTSPFVAAVHMHLPPYARWSRGILERFARTAPPNTRLDVTTMTLIGKPRVSSMVLSDLRPESRRLGMVNYVRDTSLADAKRKWWRFRAVSDFNVQEGSEKSVKTGWVWSELKEGLAKRAGGGGGGGQAEKGEK